MESTQCQKNDFFNLRLHVVGLHRKEKEDNFSKVAQLDNGQIMQDVRIEPSHHVKFRLKKKKIVTCKKLIVRTYLEFIFLSCLLTVHSGGTNMKLHYFWRKLRISPIYIANSSPLFKTKCNVWPTFFSKLF